MKINFNVFAASTVRFIGGPVLAILLVPFFGLEGMESSTVILQASMFAAVLASIIPWSTSFVLNLLQQQCFFPSYTVY
ncbi:MAG: hypothetical protein QF788_05795 [SAR324 cluster bacterium]|nr:hypothetical protein [SAR324 cluster bacterium]